MKKLRFLILTLVSLSMVGVSYGQRVQGTLKAGANTNQVTVAIKPTLAFTAQISNLIVAVQIPTSVGPRPTVTFTNLQPGLFATWEQVDVDQGDGFYTWGFNCAIPGAGNTTSTAWAATEMDVLTVNFAGAPVPPFTARLCHYLDGGAGAYAIFYVETSLAAVNNGVLSDWGNLFYGTGASNGAVAPGNIGTPNAAYSYTTVANVTLPVKFLGFNVSKKNNDAVLTWQIENETSTTDRYEVERSVNGVDFVKMTSITPKNNGSSTNSYSFTDGNLFSTRSGGVVYYRIKQVDKDGKFIITPIRNLRLDSKSMAVSVYPNPIKDNVTISLDLVKDDKVVLTINDAAGKQVRNISYTLFKGLNIKKINMSGFASGNYMLKVTAGSELKTIPLVKAN